MLKGIPSILSPELLKILMEMGHGDELLICDGNYPKFGCPERCVRLDGHGIPEILDAILTLFPLDAYVDRPATLMRLMDRDVGRVETPIWEEYAAIIAKHDLRGKAAMGNIDRFDFYDEAKDCYCILQTGESAIYANVIVQKGVIK